MKTPNNQLLKSCPDAIPPEPRFPLPDAEGQYSLAKKPDGTWGVWSHSREVKGRGAGTRRVGGYFLKEFMKGRQPHQTPGVVFSIRNQTQNHRIHRLVEDLVPKSKR